MKKVLYFIAVVFLVYSYSLYTDFKVRDEVVANEGKEVLQSFPLKSSFTNLDGVDISVESLFGSSKNVYVHFWATWCPPCEKELPALIEFAASNLTEVFILVAVNDDAEKVRKHFKGRQLPVNLILALDSHNHSSKSFGTYKLPETLYFSKDLSLLKRLKGAQTWEQSPKSP